MKIEMRPVSAVKPYEKNPRINDAAVDAVIASIKEFGWRQPIVVDAKGVIIAGHTRWKAAQKLGMTNIPVHVATDLSKAQIKAYRIADNQTAALSDWNHELLALEFADLTNLQFDVSLLGFAEEELARLLAGAGSPGLTDPDAIPAPPAAATTRPGDLWMLGDHKLLCGDSSDPAQLDRLVDGAPIHLLNTDPPYNVKVEPRSNNAIVHSAAKKSERTHHQSFDAARQGAKQATSKTLRAKDRPLANDFLPPAEFDRLLRAWFVNAARVLRPGRSFYIWGGYANVANYPPALVEAGLYFSQAIIWHKQHPVLTRKDFMGDHEWCFYGWRAGGAHQFFGPHNVPDVWSVKKVTPQKMIHLTEKPVELAARALEYSTRPGEHILDLFGGSGSTLIAAEQTGRQAFLMELDPLYCDVIVERFEKFTGRKAKRIHASGAIPRRPTRRAA